MNPLEVRTGDSGVVVLRQWFHHPDDADVVEITPDQLPLVLRWMREAADGDVEATRDAVRPQLPGPPREEVGAMAQTFRKLEDAAGAAAEGAHRAAGRAGGARVGLGRVRRGPATLAPRRGPRPGLRPVTPAAR